MGRKGPRLNAEYPVGIDSVAGQILEECKRIVEAFVSRRKQEDAVMHERLDQPPGPLDIEWGSCRGQPRFALSDTLDHALEGPGAHGNFRKRASGEEAPPTTGATA